MISIFILIWIYLIYCYFYGCGSSTNARRYNYKSRVDSTISLLETWKSLIYTESEIKLRNSELERDSILRELKKKPKVLIVPELKIKYVEKLIPESNPKLMSLGPSAETFENAELRFLNCKLEKEIDSLNQIVKNLRDKSTKDSVKYKYREPVKIKRRFSLNIFKRKISGETEQNPEFR